MGAEAGAVTMEFAEGAVGRRGRFGAVVVDAIQTQQGFLLPWVPVCLGLGIGGWFALPWEPGPAVYGAGALAALGLWAAARRLGEVWAPLLLAAMWALVGAELAALRAHAVAAPVLSFRYYGPIEGRVVDIDRSASDAIRLTLDRVRLDDVGPDRLPVRVRVSLHGDAVGPVPEPGTRVMTTGHLSPPGGPVEPGGFDFRRHSWFERLGAVGYTRVPVLVAAPAEEGRAGLAIFRLRMAISAGVLAQVPGPAGGFIAAVTSGDRSALPQSELQALRDSNLAHLLAISGLHMGLLTGVVFVFVRVALAAWPAMALRLPTKKIAAAAAIGAGAFYLALSGANVATVRAFIMVSVMLGAVLLGRRAISLRTVAVGAILILATTPEALLGPGFQMSFAATTALVAAFAGMSDARLAERVPRWSRPALGTVLSSAVAGLATAPYGAAHFNVISDYGLLANVLAVPIMGSVVMPAAVLAAVLWPFGLEAVPMEAMRLGMVWILGVAHWVSELGGSVTPVPAPGPAVLPLFTLGALVCLLWRGAGRWLGLVPVAVSVALWSGTERPYVLVSESGGLIGALTAEGRALSRSRGDGFVARVWLENDGDRADQEAAAVRQAPWEQADGVLWMQSDGWRLIHARGKAVERLPDCDPGDIVIADRTLERRVRCIVFDAAALRESGALAVSRDGQVTSARAVTGLRLWSGAARAQ